MIEEHEDHDDAAESVDGYDPASRSVDGGLRGSIDFDHYQKLQSYRRNVKADYPISYLRIAPVDYNRAIVKENRRA